MTMPATRESNLSPNIVTITDETTGSKTQHSFGNDQMAGRRNRQKFSQALDDAHDGGFEQV